MAGSSTVMEMGGSDVFWRYAPRLCHYLWSIAI